jgi:hypothetical protein
VIFKSVKKNRPCEKNFEGKTKTKVVAERQEEEKEKKKGGEVIFLAPRNERARTMAKSLLFLLALVSCSPVNPPIKKPGTAVLLTD